MTEEIIRTFRISEACRLPFRYFPMPETPSSLSPSHESSHRHSIRSLLHLIKLHAIAAWKVATETIGWNHGITTEFEFFRFVEFFSNLMMTGVTESTRLFRVIPIFCQFDLERLESRMLKILHNSKVRK